MRCSLDSHSTDLGKRTTLDKWKINVLAAIKRRLDKKAGVEDKKKAPKAEEQMEEQQIDPNYSPF